MKQDNTDNVTKTQMQGSHSSTPPYREGRIAKSIERQTAKLPSDTFLWIAVGSMGVSLALQIAGRKQESNFVGQWAPTLLILGLYNKLVKIAGSERSSGFAESDVYGVAA